MPMIHFRILGYTFNFLIFFFFILLLFKTHPLYKMQMIFDLCDKVKHSLIAFYATILCQEEFKNLKMEIFF